MLSPLVRQYGNFGRQMNNAVTFVPRAMVTPICYTEKYVISLKERRHLIVSPVAVTSQSQKVKKEVDKQDLNLETLPRPSRTQQWLFNKEDNTPHDPTLLTYFVLLD